MKRSPLYACVHYQYSSRERFRNLFHSAALSHTPYHGYFDYRAPYQSRAVQRTLMNLRFVFVARRFSSFVCNVSSGWVSEHRYPRARLFFFFNIIFNFPYTYPSIKIFVGLVFRVGDHRRSNGPQTIILPSADSFPNTIGTYHVYC